MKRTVKKNAAAAKPKPLPGPNPNLRKGILVVDDHPFMRIGLAQLIEKQPDIRVCGEAGNPAEAMQVLGRAGVDLLLTDITMPGRSGLEFIKDVRAQFSRLPILVISMHDELLYAERVLKAGARGYIMKEAGGENMLAAIRLVLSGQIYVSPRMSTRFLDDISARRPRGSQSPIEKLTDREFEVFQLFGQGHGTKDIAQKLHLSSKTVDVHRGHIKEKLGLKNVTAFMSHAVRWVQAQSTEAHAE